MAVYSILLIASLSCRNYTISASLGKRLSTAQESAVAAILEKRINAVHLRGNISNGVDGRIHVAICGKATPGTNRLLTSPGQVILRALPRGEIYKSPAGRAIKSARIGSDEMGSPALLLTFSDPSSIKKFTSRHLGKPLGFFLDGSLIAAPVLEDPLDESAEILGAPISTATVEAAILNAPPLPVAVQLRGR